MKKNIKKRIIKKLILVVLITMFILIFTAKVFAVEVISAVGEGAVYVLSGIGLLLMTIIKAVLVLVFFIISYLIGIVFSSELIALNIEDFIFNKYDLISLKVFTGLRNNDIANNIFDNVTKWFSVLFVIAIILELVVLIYIAINTVIKTFKQDPKKKAEYKKMLKDFLLGLIVLFGMGIFIITIITLNNVCVEVLSKSMTIDSKFDSITFKLFFDIIHETDIKVSLMSLILYIIISVMGVIFFVHYLKRLIKVSFLILISPLVAVTFSLDRRKGAAAKLNAWAKMFIFTVFAQTIHALIYIALVKVVITDLNLSTTGYVASAVILVSGLKFVWDAETIVKSLFGVGVDPVSSSAGFLIGMLSRAQAMKGTGKRLANKAPTINVKEGETPKKLKRDKSKKQDLKKKAEIKDKQQKDKDKYNKKQEKIQRKDDSKKKPERKLTDEDIKKQEKKIARQEKTQKFARPFVEVGTAIKQSAKARFTKDKIKRFIGRTAFKAAAGTFTAIASHATPKVGMVQAAMGGVAAADGALDLVAESKRKRKYTEDGREYKDTLRDSTLQAVGIADARAKLEFAGNLADGEKAKEKLPEEQGSTETGEQQKEQEQQDGKNEKENKSEDRDEKFNDKGEKITEINSDLLPPNAIEAYAKYIGSIDKEELIAEYEIARERCIQKYMEDTNKSRMAANKYIKELEKSLLRERDFNYENLSKIDRELLLKRLDLISKEQIDEFEYNTGRKIKYKEVAKLADKYRSNRANRKANEKKQKKFEL